MGKKKVFMLTIALAFILILSALGIIAFDRFYNKAKEQATIDKLNATTFAAYSEYEVFQKIPLLTGKTVQYEQGEDFGGDNYGINMYDTTLDEYQSYLLTLEKEGFTKELDNGTEGLEGYVYTSHYKKGDLLVVVTHFPKASRTMVTISENALLSEHLKYNESYIADNKAGKKTTFLFPELYNTGNSFVFQLKNGHFIINDGGTATELPYLLDHLDSMVPEGEKPVVEAWFITHSHTDHIGVFQAFMDKREYIDRVYVENVYFTEVNKETWEIFREFDNPQTSEAYARTVPKLLKTSDGKSPNVYRCRTGERYYFNDITIDVVYSHDLRSPDKWNTFNGASTWLMYTIEGQKVFLTADGEWDNMQTIMSIYDREYFDLTIYQTPHHGSSVWDEFTDYLENIGTIIVPGSEMKSGGANAAIIQTEYLVGLADEAYCYGEGTVMFTFPYEAGNAVTFPMREWIYNLEVPARLKEKQ